MDSSFVRFLCHTQRRTTVGRTPLDEWSARRRDLYLTIHNTHNRQIPMPIRTHNLCRRVAADLRLRQRGHSDRHVQYLFQLISHVNTNNYLIFWDAPPTGSGPHRIWALSVIKYSTVRLQHAIRIMLNLQSAVLTLRDNLCSKNTYSHVVYGCFSVITSSEVMVRCGIRHVL